MSNPELVRVARVKAYRNTRIIAPAYPAPGPPQRFTYTDSPATEPARSVETKTESLPEVSVLELDTLEAAQQLVELGYDPLVLCHADDHLPGGFVASGAGAQEEEL